MNLLERVTRAICQRRYPLTEEIACCGKCGTIEEQAQAAIFAVADDMRSAGIDEDPSGQRREPMSPDPLDEEEPFPRAGAEPRLMHRPELTTSRDQSTSRGDASGPNSDSRDGGQNLTETSRKILRERYSRA